MSFNEIQGMVKMLHKNKSPGLDGVTNEHIIYGGKHLLDHLLALYRLIIQSEYIPEPFRSGMIIPIYKGKGKPKSDPNSYRGITLTSSLGKLFEKIILERITAHCKHIGFPHDLQMGFRKGYGCTSAVFLLTECISHFIERSSPCYCAFLDNQKAFDTVWHHGLFYKLYKLGINGKLWRMICHSYGSMQSCVMYENKPSRIFGVKQGVGQGRVLSAWMFLVYINDLLVDLTSSGLGISLFDIRIPGILLCDDTTITSHSVHDLVS
jgi:hypothetical protein